jgi:hypothetical protein
MADYFRESFQHMLQATKELQAANRHLIEASQAQARSGQAMEAAFTSVLSARDEHEDVRDTVRRLEALVMELVNEVRQRRKPDGGDA